MAVKVIRRWWQEAACHSVYPVKKQRTMMAGGPLPFCKISVCRVVSFALRVSPNLS